MHVYISAVWEIIPPADTRKAPPLGGQSLATAEASSEQSIDRVCDMWGAVEYASGSLFYMMELIQNSLSLLASCAVTLTQFSLFLLVPTICLNKSKCGCMKVIWVQWSTDPGTYVCSSASRSTGTCSWLWLCSVSCLRQPLGTSARVGPHELSQLSRQGRRDAQRRRRFGWGVQGITDTPREQIRTLRSISGFEWGGI